MKYNKGQSTFFYSIMLGIVILILFMALAPAGQNFVNDAMNTSTANFLGMDCDNVSISNFDKGTCTILDFSSFYFFGSLMLISGAVILSRIIIG